MDQDNRTFMVEQEKARLRVSRLTAVIFVIVAIAFFVVAALFAVGGKQKSDEYANADKVSATVTTKNVTGSDNNRSVEIYVDYEYQGKKYENVKVNSTVNEDSLIRGDTVTVYLTESKPDSPEMDPSAGMSYVVTVVLAVLGVLFVLMLIPVLGLSSKYKKSIKELTS